MNHVSEAVTEHTGLSFQVNDRFCHSLVKKLDNSGTTHKNNCFYKIDKIN